MDGELSAMAKIQKALDSLDAETRGRVLEWIGKKYGASAAMNGGMFGGIAVLEQPLPQVKR